MFTIGDFAKHGRVSVRMLRHYDALGLLRPARVDPFTGYRFYEAGQLARLNRVIALKELGFRLDQVGTILDAQVGVEELRGMLRSRQAELESAMAAAAARLVQVEARLRTIESEGSMPVDDVVVKSLPPVRVAELSAIAQSYEPQDIGPVIGPLFGELCRRLDRAGVVPTGPGIARYEDAPDSGASPGTPGTPAASAPEPGAGTEAGAGAILVRAALPVAAGVRAADLGGGVRIVTLPAVERAATLVHRGSMDGVLPASQTLARWIDAHGYRSAGYARELSLACPEDRDQWVTELQEPLSPAS
ncbi:MerR family transcriptional regulator [Streptomyces subrutilus]|uniref:MerR family transcriptional regulator n=1 Tax=Streptomyces subrutilus TaxID=36818 RepID=A0A5P2USY0_9ACTN|nr:MerR family transcriptional regulator [Streptomyces subrutilus]QEU81970.1 MerR family transcriptional regulator [Streptomyces subrutilus]WSJ34010.1 MerR family transcriptional regulator [Streptomyces subrutilus]GGZ72229.1 MerR family transcriptional regulator [Streptomyces subrutilus]